MEYGRYTLHYEARGQVVVSERSGNRRDTAGDVSVNYRFDIVETFVDDLSAALHDEREEKAVLQHAETVVIIHNGENERNEHVDSEVIQMLERNGFEVAE